MKKQRYQTTDISFEDFLAHPEALATSDKSVTEMVEENRASALQLRKQDLALKKAKRIEKRQKK